MDFFKGYKIIKLNKEDIKKPGKFASIEIEHEGFTGEIVELLSDESFNGLVYGLRKSGNYVAVYIFKPDTESINSSVLKFYKKYCIDKVAPETIGIFESELYNEFKEQVNSDELWTKVIWGHKTIIKRSKSVGGFNLFVSLIIIAIFVAIGIGTKNIGLFVCVGVVLGIAIGAVVSIKQDKSAK